MEVLIPFYHIQHSLSTLPKLLKPTTVTVRALLKQEFEACVFFSVAGKARMCYNFKKCDTVAQNVKEETEEHEETDHS
jgi:hypothetical protein